MTARIPYGCAKAILLGEHAVVYGHDALATSLPLGFSATIDHPATGPELVVEVRSSAVSASSEDGSLLGRVLGAIAQDLAISCKRPLLLRVEGDVPIGRGLGSSAALAAVIADALGLAHGLDLDRATVARAARVGDDLFHGRASGIDAEAAARRELGLFNRAAGWRRIDPGRRLPLLIVDSGVPHSTAEVVARVALRREGDPEGTARLMDSIGRLAGAGAEAIRAADLAALGRLMNENHALLRDLGVSTEPLDEIVAEARAAGAIAAKLTGAGGGGAAIALFESPRSLEAACERLGSSRGRAAWTALSPDSRVGAGEEAG